MHVVSPWSHHVISSFPQPSYNALRIKSWTDLTLIILLNLLVAFPYKCKILSKAKQKYTFINNNKFTTIYIVDEKLQKISVIRLLYS